jgi:hypothetical protein
MKKKFLSYQLSSYELRKGGCVPGNKEKKRKRTGRGKKGRQEVEERRYFVQARKQQDHLK